MKATTPPLKLYLWYCKCKYVFKGMPILLLLAEKIAPSYSGFPGAGVPRRPAFALVWNPSLTTSSSSNPAGKPQNQAPKLTFLSLLRFRHISEECLLSFFGLHVNSVAPNNEGPHARTKGGWQNYAYRSQALPISLHTELVLRSVSSAKESIKFGVIFRAPQRELEEAELLAYDRRRIHSKSESLRRTESVHFISATPTIPIRASSLWLLR